MAQVNKTTAWCGDLGSFVTIFALEHTALRVSKAVVGRFVVPHGTPTCLLVVGNSQVWLGTDKGVVAVYDASETLEHIKAENESQRRAKSPIVIEPRVAGRELALGADQQRAQLYQLVQVADKVLAAAKSPLINAWSLDGTLLHTIDTRHQFSILAICQIGSHFVTAGWDKSIQVWSAKSLEHVATVPAAHEDVITSLVFVPESRDAPLLSASWDRTLRNWELGI